MAWPLKIQDGDRVQHRIPREILQEIQARTSLVEVIGRYVSLQKRGRSFVGLCPFHSEKSPSFHVDESRRLFYCFGCQAGGDVIKFMTLIENQPFVEAVRELAERCGVPIPERELSPEEKRRMDEKEHMYHLYEVAASFYERQLQTPAGEAARQYVLKRGLPAELIAQFRIGFVPDGWQNLVDYLNAQRHPLSLAEKAGLIGRRQNDGYGRANEGYYDRFRQRVMFPIRNVSGKVIAFGGRILGAGEPKYLNSPEHPLFHKSEALYALESARRAIGQEDAVLVVEGYFDALALHAGGISHVVATCGTSLTRQHLQILKRYTRRVVLMYDGDRAGQAAAEKSLGLFLEEGLWPYYIPLPQGKDPDEVLQEEGSDAFKQRVKQATPLLDQLIWRRARASAGDAQVREESLAFLAPHLLKLGPEKLDYYISALARHFSMNDGMVAEYLEKARAEQRAPDSLSAPSMRPTPVKPVMTLPAEEAFAVQWLLQQPEEIVPSALEAEIEHFFTHEGLKQVLAHGLELWRQGQPILADTLLAQVQEPALHSRLLELTLKPLDVPENVRERTREQCLLGIKERFFQQLSSRLKAEINHQGTSGGDPARLQELLFQKQALDRELAHLKARIRGRAG